MPDEPASSSCTPIHTRELEEGEMDDEDEGPVAQSPLPVHQLAADAGARGQQHRPATHVSPSLPIHTARSSSQAAASSTALGGNGRPPPTAPRALRQNGAHTVPTPRSAVDRAPPTAPRASRELPDSGGSTHTPARREASPRASKRRRMDCQSPELTVADNRDVEFECMQELLRRKQQRIDDLQWQLAEAQARLHIHKTRGADQDSDLTLRKKVTRKYYKRNYPDECRTDARMQELSDLSDEEPAADIPVAHLVTPRGTTDDGAAPLPEFGHIHAVYDVADDTSFCLDDEQGAAAESDMLAGMAMEKRATGSGLSALEGGRDSVAKTAIAEPGLRFSYVLLLLQENGRWLPAPIGRFGQPFWKGSSWEAFDPRRLYDKGRTDYVAPTSQQYHQLARDASLISFAFRSSTQRHIVSSALQRGAGFIDSHEPDMVSMCRTNPARLPNAIRRHYRRGRRDGLFYAEYDAADIGSHIMLSMSGPQKTQDGVARHDYKDQKRAWIQTVDRCVLDWAPLVARELREPAPAELANAVRPWPTSVDLTNGRVSEHEMYRMVWDHLMTNGLPPRSLLPGGDCHNYVRRGRFMEQERIRLTQEYEERMGPDHGGNQTDLRRWVADRMPYEPIPPGFPTVRVRLVKEKVALLAEKYRERRNEQAFIPL